MALRAREFWPLPPSWRILVADRRDEWEEAILSEFLARVVGRGPRRVVLASGRTFSAFFAELRRRVEAGRVDLGEIAFTHLDEFSGVSPATPGALAKEIRDALFPDSDPRRGSFVPCDARAIDVLARHDQRVRGADLVLLGVGANGHLAFNEPGTSLASATHELSLTEETRAVHRAAFAPAEPPRTAVTAGLGTILSGNELLVAAAGRGKAEAVRALLTGPPDPSCPASALRLHDRVTLLLDAGAASSLAPTVVAARPYRGGRVLRAPDLPRDGSWLVVAPHPDDASISCGALLASAPPGVVRRIATFSTGERADGPWTTPAEAAATRETESRAEAAALSADVRFLRAAGYRSGAFEPADLSRFTDLLAETRPTRVFAPSRFDAHPTHRLCRLVVEEGLRAHVATHGTEIELWTYEGPWRLLDPGEVDVLFAPDDDAFAVKARAMAHHRSQLERVPFELGAEALAQLRAIAHSETHLGGKKHGGFDPRTKIEAYRVERLAPVF
jgi:glucosamine-6-phosphate deaminase